MLINNKHFITIATVFIVNLSIAASSAWANSRYATLILAQGRNPKVANLAQAQPINPRLDPLQVFRESYSFCDAKTLAAFWSVRPGKAKILGGRNILAGNQTGVETALSKARVVRDSQNITCAYEEDYSYEDIVQLARYWDKSVSETKSFVSEKLGFGGYQVLQTALKQAQQKLPTQTNTADSSQEQAKAIAVFREDHSYCDALKLAEFWNSEIGNAKYSGGRFILEQRTTELEEKLTSARKLSSTQCTYDTDFSYQDMQALANYWKVSVEEVKVATAQKLNQGGYPILRDTIKAANQQQIPR